MDAVDQELELEEFKQFCFMVKPLKNCLKVNLHGLLLNLEKTQSQLKPSAFRYSLDEEESDEAQQVQDTRKKAVEAKLVTAMNKPKHITSLKKANEQRQRQWKESFERRAHRESIEKWIILKHL